MGNNKVWLYPGMIEFDFGGHEDLGIYYVHNLGIILNLQQVTVMAKKPFA